MAATAASTLSDKPRWEKDIEPLVDTAAWNPGKRLSRSTPERHADLHGIFGNADRRLIQDIAFRYRAASRRNIGANWPKSMERGPEAPKKLNVFANFTLRITSDSARRPCRRSCVTSEKSPSKARPREKPLRHFGSVDAILRTDSLARAARCGLYLQPHCEGGTIGGPRRKPIR